MPERKRTNAEIDLLNSYKKEGETTIPYELDDNGNELKPIELTPEQKAEAELKLKNDEIEAAKQKEIDDAAEAEKQRIIAQDADKNKTPLNTPATVEFELDDEKILAYLKNKKGKELTSLDELLNPKIELTEEQKQLAIEQREANKFAYGLSAGKFSKKELETFITDNKNKQELVYAHYSAEQKNKYPELKEADIKAKFEEKFSIDEGEESKDYEIGQSLITNIADNIIRQKHSKILNLENDFTSYEKDQLSKKQSETKILTQAPLYKKDVEQVRNEIKTVSIQLSDTETFEIPIDSKIVDEIISSMLENNYSQNQIEKGWNKETIKQVAQSTAIMQSMPKILRSYADAEILKKQAGVRGIPPDNQRGGKQGDVVELTEQQKQAIAFMRGEQVVAN